MCYISICGCFEQFNSNFNVDVMRNKCDGSIMVGNEGGGSM